MKYESLDKIESKKEIEELNSIKYKGLNHPLCLTRLHGITHALVYGSQRMEDYTKQHKCMFDKYISQNIKLYHDKTYQYHIKRSCKSQYKNVGLGQYKNVGFPTLLYCLF